MRRILIYTGAGLLLLLLLLAGGLWIFVIIFKPDGRKADSQTGAALRIGSEL